MKNNWKHGCEKNFKQRFQEKSHSGKAADKENRTSDREKFKVISECLWIEEKKENFLSKHRESSSFMVVKWFSKVLESCHNPNRNYGLGANQRNPFSSYKSKGRNILKDLIFLLFKSLPELLVTPGRPDDTVISANPKISINFGRSLIFQKPRTLHSKPFRFHGKPAEDFNGDVTSRVTILDLIYGTHCRIYKKSGFIIPGEA